MAVPSGRILHFHPAFPSKICHYFCGEELEPLLSSVGINPCHRGKSAACRMTIQELFGVNLCVVVLSHCFSPARSTWNSEAIITCCPTLSPSLALESHSSSQIAWPLKESGISSNVSILSCPSPLFLTLM